MVSEGLLLRCEAKAGKERELEEFLKSAQKVVLQERETTAWFAIRFDRSEFGIFDVFPDDAGREAHLSGRVARALNERGDLLLASAPKIQKLKIVAEKFPITTPTEPATKGLLLSFRAKWGHDHDIEKFLRDVQPWVLKEQDTAAWFGLQFDTGEFGIFDVFPDAAGRFKHLVGHVPRELAKHAFTLLGSFPDLEMYDVLAAKLTA